MKIVGLTGSIAMGKSTVAKMIVDLGFPVLESDAVVHQLYDIGGEAVEPISRIAPGSIVNGKVNRPYLLNLLRTNPSLIEKVEKIVHPLVREKQNAFIEAAKVLGKALTFIEVPLLFETERQKEFDATIVVSADTQAQNVRAMARPGMTIENLSFLISRQMPDAEKRSRATFVIENSGSLDDTRKNVLKIIGKLEAMEQNA